jgi:hypothetical protein
LSITSVANPSTANSVQLSEIELIGLPPPPPPTVSQPAFGGTTGRKLSLRFSSDVHNSLAAGDLQVRNTATNQLVTIPAPTYDLPTNTATFSFPADLPDGNYAVTLLAAGVSDAAGSPLDGNGDGVGGDNYTGFTFSYMAGDANRDRNVDFNDLVVLAQNYNTTSGRTFSRADFNYDGNVDFNDLVLLAQRYNTSLPPIPAPPAPAATVSETLSPATSSPQVESSKKSLFSTVPVARPVVRKPAAPVRVARR